MITSKEIFKLMSYENHRLIEMQLCADEQGFMEDWGTVRGITLGTFMILNKIIEEEMKE